MPLYKDWTGVPIDSSDQAVKAVYLGVADDKECILLGLVDRSGNTPAHILVTKENANDYICGEIHKAEPVKAYLDSKVPGVEKAGAIALGASARIYN